MIDLSHLNPEQRRAVVDRNGPLLVLAGAGTGKTRVIVHRMAALIEEGVLPENILALTFTQKAAGEMRDRVAQLVGKKVAKRMVVGTFHSFGVRLLRADVHRLGMTNAFTILDEGDQRAQVRRLLREARIEEKTAPVPDVVAALSLLKNQGASPGLMSQSRSGAAAVEILPRYNQHLRALGAVDFDDLILLPVELMKGVPDVAARIQKRFQHVLVDEFQDTSGAQMDFLLQVSARSKTVCAVGDDDQAIYGWRGAVVAHILEFENYFPGAHAVALESNYRSTPNILASANAVIACNRSRRMKTLRTDAPPQLPVRVLVCQDEEAEVRSVVVEIATGIQKGRKPEAFAILFRAGTQSRSFETALRLENIPYVLLGGQDVVERKEVKDTLAYAAMMGGRDDETSFRRVVATPSKGVGPTSVEKLLAWARENAVPLVDAAKDAHKVPGLPKKAAASLSQLGGVLVKARDAQRRAAMEDDPSDRLRELLEETGYWASLDEQDDDLLKAQRRRSSVELVLDGVSKLATRIMEGREVASEMQSQIVLEEGSALDQLLDRMALEKAPDRKEEGLDTRPGVRLMTLHASKGLEFPVVFLPGWEEGLMPHKRSLEDAANTPNSEPIPPPPADGEPTLSTDVDSTLKTPNHGVEEERRLAYVGITRAREELIITRAAFRRRYGKLVPRSPSRFIGEMPGDVLTEDRTEKPLTEAEQRAHAAEMFKKIKEQIAGRP